MTINFSNFEKLDVDSSMITKFPLDMIRGDVVLMLAPATEANKPYYNALLKKSRKKMGAIASKKVDADTVKGNRDEDRDLYAKYVLVGWENVSDSNGVAVTFDKKVAKQFLDSLPNWIFDKVRAHASDPLSILDTIDAEEVSGN